MHVIWETDSGHFDLRLYGSGRVPAASWWIGMFDSAGVLRRTWISNGAYLTIGHLQQWLRPIVGYEVARRLSRMALHAHGLASSGRKEAVA